MRDVVERSYNCLPYSRIQEGNCQRLRSPIRRILCLDDASR